MKEFLIIAFLAVIVLIVVAAPGKTEEELQAEALQRNTGVYTSYRCEFPWVMFECKGIR